MKKNPIKRKEKKTKRTDGIEKIQAILEKGTIREVRALFEFDTTTPPEIILKKYKVWERWFFPKYFKSKDAPFHDDWKMRRIRLYLGLEPDFVNVGFRGSAKTTDSKLFRAFVICNDTSHFRRFMRILSKDIGNAKQSVTDIYNMLISKSIRYYWPEVFKQTDEKRQETMGVFTTSTGVKLQAETIGTDQRGAVIEESRPDFDWYDDFETRKSLFSAIETFKIWANMQEAKTGLAKGGSSEYTCNYISERGNVHRLINSIDKQFVVIVPIAHKVNRKWVPTWDRYTEAEVDYMEEHEDDFEGERLCKPSASMDVLFDREILEKMPTEEAKRIVADFKIFTPYNPSHRYGMGSDIGGGLGLDSSTSVVIDFSVVPFKVVATYKNNLIKEDVFAYELQRQGDIYGGCLIAPEKNNYGSGTLAILKTIYDNIFFTQQKDEKVQANTITTTAKEYGWHTNTATKPKMLFALKSAVENGHLLLTDPDLIAEAKSYSRDDLMDGDVDVRLSTRHFDLLIACAIAFQMKDFAEMKRETDETELVEEHNPHHSAIWRNV